MVDYYSVLLRAVTAPGAGDAQWRRGIYDRARQMLTCGSRCARRRQWPRSRPRKQRSQAAIDRDRSGSAWTERARNRADDANARQL